MGTWDRHELYDILHDPEEKYNLIENPEYADITKQLAKDWFHWLKQTNGMQIPIKETIKRPFGDWKHPNQF